MGSLGTHDSRSDFIDGIPTVKPPLAVIEEGIVEWNFAVVGQFIGAAPNFDSMQRIINSLWGKSSPVKVSLAGVNLYVFSFGSASIRDWVLENGPCHVQNKPLVLRKWEPYLHKLDFDLSHMPVWVQLYNVPLELYSRSGLSYISSALGNPLYMDSITASRGRLEYAKVCIEISAGFVIPNEVQVILKDGSMVRVGVFIPWLPRACSICKTFGHLASRCVARQNSVPKQEKLDPGFLPSGSSGNAIHAADVVCPSPELVVSMAEETSVSAL
ncbi:uncharacterized protein LOC120178614 [Hibiscus syriacus]|uniref:uncharacterized protein LOC120178614 n=1 Tax=Hibiscus syriacus TaxID=106335 RepID=UPI00192221DB|nr:uncharacterized protein LOC120178614 [Hibiscus syriacus]